MTASPGLCCLFRFLTDPCIACAMGTRGQPPLRMQAAALQPHICCPARQHGSSDIWPASMQVQRSTPPTASTCQSHHGTCLPPKAGCQQQRLSMWPHLPRSTPPMLQRMQLTGTGTGTGTGMGMRTAAPSQQAVWPQPGSENGPTSLPAGCFTQVTSGNMRASCNVPMPPILMHLQLCTGATVEVPAGAYRYAILMPDTPGLD